MAICFHSPPLGFLEPLRLFLIRRSWCCGAKSSGEQVMLGSGADCSFHLFFINFVFEAGDPFRVGDKEGKRNETQLLLELRHCRLLLSVIYQAAAYTAILFFADQMRCRLSNDMFLIFIFLTIRLGVISYKRCRNK